MSQHTFPFLHQFIRTQKSYTEKNILMEEKFEFSDEKDPIIHAVTDVLLTADVKRASVTWKDSKNKRFLGYVVKKYRLDGDKFSLKSEVKFSPETRSCSFENMSEEKKFRVEVAAYTKNKYRRIMYGEFVQSNIVRIKSNLPEGWISIHSKSGRWYVNMLTHEKTRNKPDAKNVYYVENDIAVKFENDERAKLLERFKQFDQDNDGSLGVAEMNTVLDDLGVKFTQRKLMKVIQVIDRDHSGTIEFGEYLLMIWMLRTSCRWSERVNMFTIRNTSLSFIDITHITKKKTEHVHRYG